MMRTIAKKAAEAEMMIIKDLFGERGHDFGSEGDEF